MEPINRRQGGRSSEDRVRVIRHGGKYFTSHPLARGPFDSPRDAYRAALDRTQGPLLAPYGLRSRRASVRRFHRAGLLPAPLSEKLVLAVAESASALTLQETDVSSLVETDVSSLVETDVSSLVESLNTTSLEESIIGPGTVPHNTIGSSLRSSPFSCQKFVAASTESSSPERDVSSSAELLDATLPEETIIAIPGILPHKTADGSSSFFLLSCEKLVESIAESASVQTPQEPDVSSLGAFLDSTSSEELISASPQAEPCDQKLVAAAVESASMSSKGSTTETGPTGNSSRGRLGRRFRPHRRRPPPPIPSPAAARARRRAPARRQ